MGPPIYIGGNVYYVGALVAKTAGLQWGHRFTSVETIVLGFAVERLVLCFNGATDLHRWKRNFRRSCPSGRATCFNGATDLHRWKLFLSASVPALS